MNGSGRSEQVWRCEPCAATHRAGRRGRPRPILPTRPRAGRGPGRVDRAPSPARQPRSHPGLQAKGRSVRASVRHRHQPLQSGAWPPRRSWRQPLPPVLPSPAPSPAAAGLPGCGPGRPRRDHARQPRAGRRVPGRIPAGPPRCQRLSRRRHRSVPEKTPTGSRAGRVAVGTRRTSCGIAPLRRSRWHRAAEPSAPCRRGGTPTMAATARPGPCRPSAGSRSPTIRVAIPASRLLLQSSGSYAWIDRHKTGQDRRCQSRAWHRHSDAPGSVRAIIRLRRRRFGRLPLHRGPVGGFEVGRPVLWLGIVKQVGVAVDKKIDQIAGGNPEG